MTPADELRTAVAELRSGLPGYDVPVPNGTLPADVAEALANWLEIAYEYVSKSPHLTQSSPFRRGGVEMARVINGSQP